MILLREKGAHGASARCEQICMLLPQRSQGSTLKNHMLLIANTTTVASQTDPISSAHMASRLYLVMHDDSAVISHISLACNSGAVGDEKHMIFECTALAPLRQQHADLFTPRTVTMRSFFAQQNHLGVLNYVIDCLNFMNI